MNNKKNPEDQEHVEPSSTPGYPEYPASDDIYSKDKEIRLTNSDDLSTAPEPSSPESKWNEKNFSDELTGDDLDVPGSEAEEEGAEIPGKEDEENEYYSLGGDDHDDLDEDNG